MKRLLLNILLCATLFVGCKDQVLGLDESEVLVVSTNNIEVDADANEVTVEVNSYLDYNVYCDVGWSWITPSAKSGSAGTKRITFAIAENLTIAERSATITIGDPAATFSETISVLQAAGAPFIKSSVTEISADAERFSTKIDVDSNIDYTISSSEKWCHLGGTSGKAGKQTLDIIVDENTDTLARKATITLENKEHKVTTSIAVSQGAFNPVVTVDTETLEFAAEGGLKEVAVTSNFEYEVTETADWLSVEKTETGLNVIALPNEEEQLRTADITLANVKYSNTQTLKVTQAAFGVVFKVEPTIMSFDFVGGTQNLAVTANIEYEVSTDADWLTIEKGDGGISITTSANIEGAERTALVVLSNEKLARSQVQISQIGLQSLISSKSDRVIVYTSSDNNVITPYRIESFDATIVHNCYLGDVGYIIFDKPITKIGTSAFEKCSKLSSITIPNSVKTIGSNAFCYSQLKSVTIGTGVISIGKDAFAHRSEGSVHIADLSAWCKIDFGNIEANPLGGGNYFHSLFINGTEASNITIPSDITKIKPYAFSNCYSLTNVIIPNSVTSIGDYAFYNCYNLASITIPNSVTSIGDYAFYWCSDLISVDIPNSVTSIAKYAFYACTSLISITIPNSVTSIGERALYGCENLTSITIPNNVTSIGEHAFWNCYDLRSVYCKPITPPSGDEGMFSYYDWVNEVSGKIDCVIYVPRSSVDAYKSASGWRNYASQIVGYDF